MQTNITLKIEKQSEFDSILKAIGMRKMLLSCETITAHFDKHKTAILDFIYEFYSTKESDFKSEYPAIKKKLLTSNLIFTKKQMVFLISDCEMTNRPTLESLVMAAKYFHINKIQPYDLFMELFNGYKLELIGLKKDTINYRMLVSELSTDEIEFIFGIYRVGLLYTSHNIWDKETDKDRAIIDYESHSPYRDAFLNEVRIVVSSFAAFAQCKEGNIKYKNILYDFESKEVFFMVKAKVAEMLASEMEQIKAILDKMIGEDLTMLAGNEDEYEDRYFVKKIYYLPSTFELHFEVRQKYGILQRDKVRSTPSYLDHVGSNEKETAIKLLKRIT